MNFPCKDCTKLDSCLKQIYIQIFNIEYEGRVLSLNNTKLFLKCKQYREFITENEQNFNSTIDFFISLINPKNILDINKIQHKPYRFWILQNSKFKGDFKSTNVDFAITNRLINKKGTVRSYIGYDSYCSKIRNKSIEEMFNAGMYAERNLIIVEFLKNINQSLEIFEFAATYGFLALQIAKYLKFKRYITSNFLPEVVEYMKKQELEDFGIEVLLFDANNIISNKLEEFNTFICTSLEHIEKDKEIISSLPNGSTFLFSVPNFDEPTHFRSFKNQTDIFDRYKNIIQILKIVEVSFEHMKKFVCFSKRI
jgi:hypothetical protein